MAGGREPVEVNVRRRVSLKQLRRGIVVGVRVSAAEARRLRRVKPANLRVVVTLRTGVTQVATRRGRLR